MHCVTWRRESHFIYFVLRCGIIVNIGHCSFLQEQFASYAEKVQLARSNGVRQHPDPTIMDTIRGLGKVGIAVGALTLLVWSVKEALS